MTAWAVRTAHAWEADAVADLHAVSWRSAYRGIFPDHTLGDSLTAGRRAYWQKAFARTDWGFVLVADEAGALVGAAAARIAAAGRRSVYLWVYDANEPAKRFYRRLGGAVAESGFHESPGVKVPGLRIAWPDAAMLAAACAPAAP